MSEYNSNISKPRERKVFESPESLKAELLNLRERVNTLSEKPIEITEDTIDGLLGSTERPMIYRVVRATDDSTDTFTPYNIIVYMSTNEHPVQIKIGGAGVSIRTRNEGWGEWELYTTSSDLKILEEILSMPPWEIEPETGKWKKYSPEEKAYIPTDYPSRGEQGEKGEKGDKGEQGDAGAAGYTPQKGIDYWTAEDKEEIRSYVESAILGGAW